MPAQLTTILHRVAKVNIFTDLCVTGENAIKNSNKSYLKLRTDKVEAMKRVVEKKMVLFGSAGRY